MRRPPRFALSPDRRAIIDRRALADQLQKLPAEGYRDVTTALLQGALDKGR
jgi:hypothetical protein